MLNVEKIHQAQRGATVLVVEDDTSLQALMAHALRAEGYHVMAAGDMAQARAAAAQYPGGIDLILTDIHLPSGNGMALAAEIVSTRPGTPVLYVSGLAKDAIQAVQHEGAPAGGFLAKPFTPKALVGRVREIVPLPAPEPPTTLPITDAAPDSSARLPNSDAVYRLETPVRCPQCGETISALRAIRLLRTEVNFTSTLPRRGRILACPCCQAIVPAELTNF